MHRAPYNGISPNYSVRPRGNSRNLAVKSLGLRGFRIDYALDSTGISAHLHCIIDSTGVVVKTRSSSGLMKGAEFSREPLFSGVSGSRSIWHLGDYL